MKYVEIEIDKLIVDSTEISPLGGEQFRRLVEQALQQRMRSANMAAVPAAKDSVAISIPSVSHHDMAGRVQFAANVGQAIHQGLVRKV